jgi:GMP synthase (glutamine-hydrolysing)
MVAIFRHADEATLRDIAEELRVRKADKLILLFSMGSQFDHLIVQQLAKLGVFCLVADPAQVKAADVKKLAPAGIILSGGPASVHAEPPPFDAKIFDIGIPLLGICLGFQMLAAHVGAKVATGEKREFGVHALKMAKADPLFRGMKRSTKVLQSHGDKIFPSRSLTVLGSTDNAPVAAGSRGHLWGVQFHPEVTDSEEGPTLFRNFCFGICGIKDAYPSHSVAQQKIAELRKIIVGNPSSPEVTKGRGKNVLLALSGGSDSSVVAYLLKEAMKGTKGELHGVYIRGIDRPDDEAYVRKCFGNKKWITVRVVDATQDFLDALAGKHTMPEKRMAMRGVYKSVLEKEIKSFDIDFIAQGTLYTDLRESGHGHSTGARVATIKTHHNTNLGFSVPELAPLDDCVKDNARDIGRDIGVPEDLLIRHPFPGPGLVVRIEGEVNEETLRIARAIDGIYIEELRRAKLYNSVWQAGATLTRSEHTVSKGDDAGMGRVVALWAVWSVNGFTTRFAQLPYDFLDHVSRRITNEVREVGAVVYRVSDKPPATIEFG